MRHSDLIAVVGGGPAGALAAAELARGGRKVVLFDEKLAWEKPCGGGITHKALAKYPFLQDVAVARNMVDVCEFISPAGRRTTVQLDRPVAIFSRHVLNGMLLDRAEAAGTELHRERVTAIERQNSHFVIRTKQNAVCASFVVLAAGARNLFRAQFFRAFEPDDMMATVGYYIPGSSDAMQVRFMDGIEGYIWTFPRCDHYSAGICGRMRDVPTSELRRRLEEFLTNEGFSFENAEMYAHILPAPRAATLKHMRAQGEGWAMVGDSAGFVDPVTGEGLYYAMRSGDLLAQALLADRPEAYSAMVKQDFLSELIEGCKYAERFFRGTFLGETVVERMIQFTAESSSFRELLSDLFAGTQGYIGLKARCYNTLPRLVRDFVASVGGWRERKQLTREGA
jgi:geranylgeranyl reductase family protein